SCSYSWSHSSPACSPMIAGVRARAREGERTRYLTKTLTGYPSSVTIRAAPDDDGVVPSFRLAMPFSGPCQKTPASRRPATAVRGGYPHGFPSPFCPFFALVRVRRFKFAIGAILESSQRPRGETTRIGPTVDNGFSSQNRFGWSAGRAAFGGDGRILGPHS